MKPSTHFLTALTAFTLFNAAASLAEAAEQVVASPGGQTEIRLSDESGQANFTVKFKGQTLVTPSPLGLVLDKGGQLSRNLRIVGSDK